MTPAGLEPAIPGSVGRCLIHWATGPLQQHRPIASQPTPRHIKDIQHLCTRYMRHPGGGGAATAIGHLPPTDGPSSLDPHLHRSHFGPRYTLGCCGHASLFAQARLPWLANSFSNIFRERYLWACYRAFFSVFCLCWRIGPRSHRGMSPARAHSLGRFGSNCGMGGWPIG